MVKETHKYGFDSKGNQRYYNTKTKKTFIENKKRYSEAMKLIAIWLYFNGLTSRKVGDMFGVRHTTILYWINKFSLEVPENQQINYTINHLEIDEMFTYIEKKRKKHIYG